MGKKEHKPPMCYFDIRARGSKEVCLNAEL
jgi:hypothetical protein